MAEQEVTGWTARDSYTVRELAHQLLQEGQIEAARDLFAGLVQLESTDAYAQTGLGICFVRLHQTQEADRALCEAIRLDPNDWIAPLHLAELRLRSGEKHEARDAAARAEQTTRSDDCPQSVRQRALALFEIAG